MCIFMNIFVVSPKMANDDYWCRQITQINRVMHTNWLSFLLIIYFLTIISGIFFFNFNFRATTSYEKRSTFKAFLEHYLTTLVYVTCYKDVFSWCLLCRLKTTEVDNLIPSKSYIKIQYRWIKVLKSHKSRLHHTPTPKQTTKTKD